VIEHRREQPQRYEIRVRGHLDGLWLEWFDGLSLSHEPDSTSTLTGLLTDQAALYGLLDKIRDLGLPLLSVNRIESKEEGIQ
jgi:hypothetical protein